jgi:hypothetical protein
MPPPQASPNGLPNQHFTSLLDAAGISWKNYSENYTDGVCPLTVTGYGTDPFVYFNDVTASSTYCTSHLRNYSDLASDLANNTAARYNFITPNMCDNMHDSCLPTNDPIKQGDTWLSTEVPKIMNSEAYQNGGAIIITWDEAATLDGPIGMIVISSLAKGNGYSDSIHYTHSSTLRTLEEIFGVSTLLGDAQNATDLSDLFTTFP